MRLEFRISGEFAGTTKAGRHTLWCDGLVPEHYDLHGHDSTISGLAWITASIPATFTLHLVHPAYNRSTIDWSANLPPEDMTNWLEIDLDRHHLIIRPGDAVPDEPWR